MILIKKEDSAVSPVVGVMLMLVVVIIIAALVSAFGGGLMESQKKVPQATFSGSYSQYNGLTITHMGGDSLDTTDTVIVIRRSDEFGEGQSLYGQLRVNESTITNGEYEVVKGSVTSSESTSTGSLRYWTNATGGTHGVFSWTPGQTMYVKGGTDLQNSGLINSANWPPCYNAGVNGFRGGTTCTVVDLNNQYNIGKKITVEIMQKNGKMISSFDIPVQP